MKRLWARMNKKGEGEKGFTLIELTVVLVVIAVLVAILAPQLTGFNRDAKVSACNANIKALQSAVAAYMAANDGDAPADQADLVTGNYIGAEVECPVDDSAAYTINDDGTISHDHDS